VRIAFIGLGNVGQPLAANVLRAGHELMVHDLDAGRARELKRGGARWAPNAREAARHADTVITSLPSPRAVAEAMEGDEGVLAGLARGATWIEMSTTDARELERLAGLVAERGAATLEAPVTGGCHRARSGAITILVGGERDVFEREQPLLETMGGRVLYMGLLGNASVVKVVSNMLALTHLWAIGEGLALAHRAGIGLGDFYEAIKASSGNSFVHETETQVILNGSYNIGFTMDLACKDLGIAGALGRELGVPLELAALVEAIFARGRLRYGDRAWSTQVVRLLEEELGVDLRAPGFPAELIDDERRSPP